MADFTRLSASIDGLTVAVDRVVASIDDSGDQANVDAAADRVDVEKAKLDAAVPPTP